LEPEESRIAQLLGCGSVVEHKHGVFHPSSREWGKVCELKLKKALLKYMSKEAKPPASSGFLSLFFLLSPLVHPSLS
jgi:hypothetical protein